MEKVMRKQDKTTKELIEEAERLAKFSKKLAYGAIGLAILSIIMIIYRIYEQSNISSL
jgi:hypothetical protein